MSTKYPAKGVKILAGAAAAPTNEVPAIKTIAMKGGEREMIDVTNMQSSGTEESIPNPLRKVRSIDVTLIYDPADTMHERLRAAHAAGTLEYQTLVLPDAGNAQWAFSGYITEMTVPELNVNGALESTYTFVANTAETFTA